MAQLNVFQVILAAGARVSTVKDRLTSISTLVTQSEATIAADKAKLANLGESAKRVRAESDIAHIFAKLSNSDAIDWDQAKEALDPANRTAQRELFNALDSAVQIQLVGAKGQKKETVGAGTALGRVGHDQYRGWLDDNKENDQRTALTATIATVQAMADKGHAVVDGLADFVASVEALITEAATASPAKGKVIADELDAAVSAAEAVIAEYDKPADPTPEDSEASE